MRDLRLKLLLQPRAERRRQQQRDQRQAAAEGDDQADEDRGAARRAAENPARARLLARRQRRRAAAWMRLRLLRRRVLIRLPGCVVCCTGGAGIVCCSAACGGVAAWLAALARRMFLAGDVYQRMLERDDVRDRLPARPCLLVVKIGVGIVAAAAGQRPARIGARLSGGSVHRDQVVGFVVVFAEFFSMSISVGRS